VLFPHHPHNVRKKLVAIQLQGQQPFPIKAGHKPFDGLFDQRQLGSKLPMLIMAQVNQDDKEAVGVVVPFFLALILVQPLDDINRVVPG